MNGQPTDSRVPHATGSGSGGRLIDTLQRIPYTPTLETLVSIIFSREDTIVSWPFEQII